jgi:hypothetical protein
MKILEQSLIRLYFDDDLNRLLTGLKTPYEKLTRFIILLRPTHKWNDYYGYSCNDGVKKSLQRQDGQYS